MVLKQRTLPDKFCTKETARSQADKSHIRAGELNDVKKQNIQTNLGDLDPVSS